MDQDLNRVYAKVNIDHLIWNKRAIESHLEKDVTLMGVVKSDSYGHGSVAVSKALEADGIKNFAVAIVDEAILLRKEGITSPILILGYTFKNQFKDLVENDLTQVISTVEEAKGLSQVGEKHNKTLKIHIEIDTGMSRLGFLYDDNIVEKILEISKMNYLEIQGIFTHFAKADESDKDYTLLQLKRFNKVLEDLEEKGLKIPMIHASNSAGVIDHKDAHFNLIRPGIALYGLYPSIEVQHENVPLKPVLSLVSKVVHIKNIPKGTSISYGGTFVTNRESKIGVVPVGYGDGYPRQLSSVGRVIVNGQYAPILGRVCMDKFMVDLTDIDNVTIEDEVILIGEDKGLKVSTEEIANKIGTINYEIICQLGKRIPRAYYKNDEIIHILTKL